MDWTPKNFDSCVGRIRYGDGEKSIGIWSHLDVVPVGGYWEHDPFEPVVEQGYMIARGCQDNKSSAVMALYVPFIYEGTQNQASV